MDSNLVARVLSAAVLIPLVIAAILLGGWWLFVSLLIIVGLAIYEFVGMLKRLGYQPQLFFAVGLGYVILTHAFLPGLGLFRPAVSLVLLASLFWHLFQNRSETRLEDWLLCLGAAGYVSWMASHMLHFETLAQGNLRLLSVIGVTALADTGAYFAGRMWGRHPLAPRISPKKTWEGVAGGIVLSLLGGAVLSGLLGLGWWQGVVAGLWIAVVAPLGDLSISMIKRQVGIKDTGNVIPGHGGMLDRLDSILVTVLVGYYYHWLLAGGAL